MTEKFYSNNVPRPSCRSPKCDCTRVVKPCVISSNSKLRLMLPPKIAGRQFLFVEILEDDKNVKMKRGDKETRLMDLQPPSFVGLFVVRILAMFQEKLGIKPAEHTFVVELEVGEFTLISSDGSSKTLEYVGDMPAEDIETVNMARNSLADMLDDIRQNYGHDQMAELVAYATSLMTETDDEFDAVMKDKKPSSISS